MWCHCSLWSAEVEFPPLCGATIAGAAAVHWYGDRKEEEREERHKSFSRGSGRLQLRGMVTERWFAERMRSRKKGQKKTLVVQ